MLQVILVLLLAFGVVLLTWRSEGGWLTPALFFGLVWVAYGAAALFFIVDWESYLAATLWILASCVAVTVGSLLAREVNGAPTSVVHAPITEADFPWLRQVTAALVAVGLLEVLFIVAKAGFSVGSLASFAILSSISAANRAAFQYGDVNQGLVERAAFVLLYAGPLFGGLLFRLTRSRLAKVLSISTLVLVMLVGMLYGSRMGVLFGGCYWIAAYVAAHVLVSTESYRARKRFLVRIGAVALVVVFGFSLVVLLVRYAAASDRGRQVMLLISDPFTFIAALGIWLQEQGLRASEFLLGYRTFVPHATSGRAAAGGLFDWLRLNVNDPAPIYVGWLYSNVYTVFRGLIEDFGTAGALVWLGGFGAVGTWLYQRVREGRRAFLPLLTAAFAFVFVGVGASVFSYNTTAAALVLFVGYFVALALVERAVGRRRGQRSQAPPPSRPLRLASVLAAHPGTTLPLVVACVGAGTAVGHWRAVYAARSAFVLNTRDLYAAEAGRVSPGLGTGLRLVPSIGDPMRTVVQLLQSRALLEQVAQSRYRVAVAPGGTREGTLADLYGFRDRTPSQRVRRAVDRLQQDVQVVNLATSLGAGVIHLEVRAPWPALAAAINQRVLERLEALHEQLRRTRGQAAREYLETSVAFAQRAVRSAEEELQRFLAHNARYTDSPALALEAMRLRRQVLDRAQVLGAYQQQWSSARSAEVGETPALTVVDPPEASSRPVGNIVADAFVWLVTGLLLALAVGQGRVGWRRLRGERPAEVLELRRAVSAAAAALLPWAHPGAPRPPVRVGAP